MTRGNQRDTDRAKAQKKAQGQKSKNSMSGTQYQKSKEDAATIMREKQRKADEKKSCRSGGRKEMIPPTTVSLPTSIPKYKLNSRFIFDENNTWAAGS
ncbi:uncharacterized protein N7483_012150 [Penicillium malachiteum]|uniref:uncharacterized protein n=1 Tax=Penicillium malachiteum TaxID=1324776 RepID=UPI0025485166|nr:uncharacterized protein N7483_012150 [Penicillium malachiteum]KAJ5714969.1 hypothetical protein N7483_012150 [Penicillium malachiteum]